MNDNRLLVYFFGITSGLLSSILLLLIEVFPNPWFFLVVLVLWLGYFFLIHNFLRKNYLANWLDLCLLIITVLSVVGLSTMVIRWSARILLIFVVGFIVALIYGWTMLKNKLELHLKVVYRRMVMILLAFDAYAGITSVFALRFFFQDTPFWLLSLCGSAVLAIVAYLIWELYREDMAVKLWSWSLLIFLLMFELIWIINLLPFGYFVLGLFTAWIWYVLQLLFRFHFSKEGVVWKKQTWFLLTNAVLYTAVFFLVRWID